MQSELIHTLFEDFLLDFNHFFQICSDGFINEFISNMFYRQICFGEVVEDYGRKINTLKFIVSGQIELFLQLKHNCKGKA